MADFLKGNFKVKRDIEVKEEAEKASSQKIREEVRKRAISSLGGSMVYVEHTDLVWDGDSETNGKE